MGRLSAVTFIKYSHNSSTLPCSPKWMSLLTYPVISWISPYQENTFPPNDASFSNLYYRSAERLERITWRSYGHGWDQNSNTLKVQNMRNYYSQVKSSCPTAEYGMTRLMVKASRLFCFSINKQAFYSILSHPCLFIASGPNLCNSKDISI